MRIVTAATLAFVALLSLFATATVTPFGDALGEVSRAMNALREADLALANLQKHVGLLGASDAKARQSLDLTLAVIENYITTCSDRLLESRRQFPAAPKPGKSADDWSSIKDEEDQFRVIGFALFQDKHGVMDIKGFHGRSKLESGPWAKPNEMPPHVWNDILAHLEAFDTGFQDIASDAGNIFQLLFQVPITGTENTGYLGARSQSKTSTLMEQHRVPEAELLRLVADCDKRLSDLQKKHDARLDQLDHIFNGNEEETLRLLDYYHRKRSVRQDTRTKRDQDRKVVQSSKELIEMSDGDIVAALDAAIKNAERLDAVLKKTDKLKASLGGGAPTPHASEKATRATGATSRSSWYHAINEYLKTNSEALIPTPTNQTARPATHPSRVD